jgi:ABC-type amino acid transport substrate-binding protein
MTHSIASTRRVGTALFAALLCLATSLPALAEGTLDKARQSGKLTMGYVADAQPFSYADASGKPTGYAIALCSKLGDSLKSELKMPALALDFVPVSKDERFSAVAQGKVDVMCGAVETLERRAQVDFSIPILLSGSGAAVRADATARLVQALSGRDPAAQPIWRGSQGQAPERRVLAVIGGTAVESVLLSRLKQMRIVAEVVTVKDTAAGLQMLLDRRADVFFNDRVLLLDAAARSPSRNDIVVLDRLFRRDLVALAVRRDDGDFRLAVDRSLSRMYRSDELASIYTSHFGPPDRATLDFFQLVALPD